MTLLPIIVIPTRIAAQTAVTVDLAHGTDREQRTKDTLGQLLTTYATAVATGVASLVSVLDPELVVLSGDVFAAGGTALRDLVQAELDELAASRPRLAVAEVTERPVLRGALERALAATRDEVFDTSR